jgi:hypothetical protein
MKTCDTSAWRTGAKFRQSIFDGLSRVKSTSFCPDPLDASQSGISLLLIAFKVGFKCNREVLINYPLEYGNAMLVPPFTSYNGGIHFWL